MFKFFRKTAAQRYSFDKSQLGLNNNFAAWLFIKGFVKKRIKTIYLLDYPQMFWILWHFLKLELRNIEKKIFPYFFLVRRKPRTDWFWSQNSVIVLLTCVSLHKLSTGCDKKYLFCRIRWTEFYYICTYYHPLLSVLK